MEDYNQVDGGINPDIGLRRAIFHSDVREIELENRTSPNNIRSFCSKRPAAAVEQRISAPK